MLWHIHSLTGNRAAGEAAIARSTAGRDAWATMAELAKDVYRPDISYGGGLTGGHWLDRIPAFDDDIADLRIRLEKPAAPATKVDEAAAARALSAATSKPSRRRSRPNTPRRDSFKRASHWIYP